MSETSERSSLDLRCEGYRSRDEAAEARLLASISERGIEEPLGGVDTPQGRVLLDGFRRNRCAAKLGIACLLGARRQRSLSILEQARFVQALAGAKLSVREIPINQAYVPFQRDF